MSLIENVVDGGLDLGPAAEALTSLGADRAALVERLNAYRAERAARCY
jgi:hypothetical protein